MRGNFVILRVSNVGELMLTCLIEVTTSTYTVNNLHDVGFKDKFDTK